MGGKGKVTMRIQKPKYVINVQMTPELAEKLDKLSAARNVPRTVIIREAVERMVAVAKVKGAL